MNKRNRGLGGRNQGNSKKQQKTGEKQTIWKELDKEFWGKDSGGGTRGKRPGKMESLQKGEHIKEVGNREKLGKRIFMGQNQKEEVETK